MSFEKPQQKGPHEYDKEMYYEDNKEAFASKYENARRLLDFFSGWKDYETSDGMTVSVMMNSITDRLINLTESAISDKSPMKNEVVSEVERDTDSTISKLEEFYNKTGIDITELISMFKRIRELLRDNKTQLIDGSATPVVLLNILKAASSARFFFRGLESATDLMLENDK